MTKFSESDQKKIASLFRNSRILALGEGIHTSDGFYQAKLAVLRHLIEAEELRLILFETPWSQAEVIEDYLEGKASLSEAMDGLLYVWRSASVADFLVYLKELRERGVRVQFKGFDIQSPLHDLAILDSDTLQTQICSILDIDRTEGDLSLKEIIGSFSRSQDSNKLLKRLLEVAQEIESGFLSENNRLHAARIALSEYLRYTAHYALGLAEEDQSTMLKGSSIRDRGMARIVDIASEGAQAALWAHNLHIIKNGPDNVARPHYGLGDHLYRAYGDSYTAIAVSSYDCHINWPQIPEMEVVGLPHQAESVEHCLGRVGPGYHFYLLTNDKLGDSKKVLQAIEVDRLANHFDGLIYMENSEAMVIYKPDFAEQCDSADAFGAADL